MTLFNQIRYSCNTYFPLRGDKDCLLQHTPQDESKELAFARSKECWSKLVSELTPLCDTRPTILNECKAYCDGKVAKAIKEKQSKADRNL